MTEHEISRQHKAVTVSCNAALTTPLRKCVYLIMTLQVEILNPKATTLLQNLADLNLISIKGNQDDGFMKIVKKLRLKAGKNPPSLDEITKEVESVRSKRYGKQKG